MSEEYTVLSIVRRRVNIKRLAGRNWRFISLRGSEAPGFAFGSPASRRCAAGAARRTRFHPASPSAHLPAAAARRAPLAELVFQEVISESTVLSEYYFFWLSFFI